MHMVAQRKQRRHSHNYFIPLSLQIVEGMSKFDLEEDKWPLFRMVRQYMQMVPEMQLIT